jgi:hypothetical protein
MSQTVKAVGFTALKPAYNLSLTRNTSLPFAHMALDQFQMPFDHCQIHRASYPCRRRPARRAAPQPHRRPKREALLSPPAPSVRFPIANANNHSGHSASGRLIFPRGERLLDWAVQMKR